jgi:hypothetical protein
MITTFKMDLVVLDDSEMIDKNEGKRERRKKKKNRERKKNRKDKQLSEVFGFDTHKKEG